ncbi:hypothetical protein D9M70_614150 [compost metagenome]
MLRSRENSLLLVRPGRCAKGLMRGTPLVPMMLLIAICDCSPVIALWPPRNTATCAPTSQRTSSAA